METLKPHVEELAQVRRITEHHLFRGSQSLCRLLRFLVEHAANPRSEPLREFDIATQVFKRRPDFDPQMDSIVRVQMGRLRARLTQYYFEAGISDPIVFEIPRGGYSLSLSYRERPHAREEAPSVTVPTPPPEVVAPRHSQRRNVAIAILSTAVVTVGLISGINEFRKPQLPPPLARFWNPFTSVPVAPLVIYSNQVRVAPSSITAPQALSPTNPPEARYTGIGEVMGAVRLTQFFDRIGHDISFRGESFTPWEDVKNSNLIFIGTATLSLKAVGKPERFMLRRQIPGDATSPVVIVDLKPEQGKPEFYRHSDCCQPIEEDYALLMFSPALTPNRVALTMFGTTTFGTQAAVEFACDLNSVASLLKFLPENAQQSLPFFEAVLRVRVRGNAPVATELVAFHLRNKH